MLILNARDVRLALPMAAAIAGMKRAFSALTSGRAEVPLRTTMKRLPRDGLSLIMPAYVEDAEGRSFAVKVVSLYPQNRSQGLPFIQAAVLVLDAETGRPLAMLDGAALTAIRTGAASGAATDLMARSDCRSAAIFGAGVQARTQLEAVCTVRKIETAWIFSRTSSKAEVMANEWRGRRPVPEDLRVAASPREAVRDADIVCTATTSKEPVFDDADLKEGVHINAVGSFEPHVRELPTETVARALLVVDSREAALEETGDLIQPIQAGVIGEDHIQAELGELVLSKREDITGRSSSEQTTLFKSVGVAVQDAVAAQLALKRANELGIGQKVEW